MKIRLIGTDVEVAEFLATLHVNRYVRVITVSRPYFNRRDNLVRRDVEIECVPSGTAYEVDW